MNPSDYRRDFAAYCAALRREQYQHYAGLSNEPRFEPIRERYADLWTREAIDELRRALDEASTQFETERAGLRALIAAAYLNFLESRASEVTSELARCAGAARIDWSGAKMAADKAPDLISDESDATRRRELEARWFDALRPCDDLRGSRLDALREAASELGFRDLCALYEDVTDANLEKLAASASSLLEQTAPVYVSRLAQWAARESQPLAPDTLTYADSLRFERAAHLDAFFQPYAVRTSYAETMAGLGIRVETQRNMGIESAPHTLKNKHVICLALKPPEDVRLLVSAEPLGALAWKAFLYEAGRAQASGWVSSELSARYPEFVYAPDGATNEAYGFLFAGLLYDAAWIGEHQGVRAAEASEVARTLALLEMNAVRRDCAALLYALALSDAPDTRAESLGETYARLHTEATGFRYSAATRLLHTRAAFRAAELLRARLFAASLREYLRERYGRRWYGARKAGQELIDIWNTASRYKVEELARLVGTTSLSFDLLADELAMAVSV